MKMFFKLCKGDLKFKIILQVIKAKLYENALKLNCIILKLKPMQPTLLLEFTTENCMFLSAFSWFCCQKAIHTLMPETCQSYYIEKCKCWNNINN